jgi:hypothetical protein
MVRVTVGVLGGEEMAVSAGEKEGRGWSVWFGAADHGGGGEVAWLERSGESVEGS